MNRDRLLPNLTRRYLPLEQSGLRQMKDSIGEPNSWGCDVIADLQFS